MNVMTKKIEDVLVKSDKSDDSVYYVTLFDFTFLHLYFEINAKPFTFNFAMFSVADYQYYMEHSGEIIL